LLYSFLNTDSCLWPTLTFHLQDKLNKLCIKNGLPVAFPNLQSLLEASSKLPSEHFGFTWETHDEPNAEEAYDHIPLEVQWEEALPLEDESTP
jgi:hypothetical protein